MEGWDLYLDSESEETSIVTMEDQDGKGSIASSEDTTSTVSVGASTDLEENYYSHETDDEALTTIPALEAAIAQVKIAVLNSEGVSEDRRKSVKRLIELRLRLEDMKESACDGGESPDNLRVVNSHQFVLQKKPLHRRAQYCDKCGGVIWTIVQAWYKCKGCTYQCHGKCVHQVVRLCQSVRVNNETNYILDICPEVGLPWQKYKCAECKNHFTLKSSWMEPRRCDYDGLYYCPMCHKQATVSIPARIVHNWDFEERPVSECNHQFLSLMYRRPNIHLEKVNKKLFYLVETLNTVKRIREDIIIMKQYFMTCREASTKKLLRLLEERQHFVDNSYMYSMQDLCDIHTETLPKLLEKIHSTFIKHIKEECTTCKGKGFICEICENVQVLFPFDSATHQCPRCFAVFHNICFAKRDQCPKCVRKGRHRKGLQNSS